MIVRLFSAVDSAGVFVVRFDVFTVMIVWIYPAHCLNMRGRIMKFMKDQKRIFSGGSKTLNWVWAVSGISHGLRLAGERVIVWSRGA
jgi:hypothetical protein